MTNFLDYLPIFVSCSISFSSDWHFYNSGTSWSEEIMRDPLKRVEMKKRQIDTMKSKYPDIFEGYSAKNVDPALGFGVATVPSFFGAKIRFSDTMDPIALPIYEQKLNGDPFNLKVPDLDTEMRFLFEEIDILQEAGYKKAQIGMPDMQGPLNIAMRLIGDKKMISFIARPNKEKEVRHILNITKETYILSIKKLRKELGKPENGQISVSGCTHYYISPKNWINYINPIVHDLEAHFGDLRLHHCGEANHERIDAYSQVRFREVEFGFGTDIKYVREKFVHPKLGPIHISCRISPFRMLNQTAEAIKKDAEYLLSAGKGGPMSISVVGVPYNTPDENIYALWNTVQHFNEEKANEE